MSASLAFLIGAFTGASIVALWAITALRDWSETQHAAQTDAERRAFADGYEQGVTDAKRPQTLRARHTVLNLHLIPAFIAAIAPAASDTVIVLAAFSIAYIAGVLIAYLFHITNRKTRP